MRAARCPGPWVARRPLGGYETLVSLADVVAAQARLRPHLPATPTVASHGLSELLGGKILLKAENLQVTGSFKSRGALNWVLTADPGETATSLVTVSAGNHAQALA